MGGHLSFNDKTFFLGNLHFQQDPNDPQKWIITNDAGQAAVNRDRSPQNRIQQQQQQQQQATTQVFISPPTSTNEYDEASMNAANKKNTKRIAW